MYVTAPNECYALDAGSGRQIWHYKRPRTTGLSTGGSANRGVAVAGDRVFMVTDNAHVIALNRFTGELLWDTELADWRKNYAASSAPLPAGNLVISGVAGGEHGANGFVAAHDQETGKEVWRFWTVPKPRRAGIGDVAGQGHRARRRADLVHRQLRSGARHRLLADRQSEQGVQRRRSPGRQPLRGLHPRARSQDRRAEVALPVHAARSLGLGRDADLGAGRRRLAGPAAQADAARQPQRLLLRVRSRATARCCWRSRSSRNLTWASGIGADGRPDQAARTRSRRRRARRCARRRTARPTGSRRRSIRRPGLYYVQTFEKCSIYTKTRQGDWETRQVLPRRLAAHRARSRSRSGS